MCIDEPFRIDLASDQFFCYLIYRVCGVFPDDGFLVKYKQIIDTRPVWFCKKLAENWAPDLARLPSLPDYAALMSTGGDMSIAFLMQVDPGRFLEFAYFEYLQRPVDAGGARGYGAYDFRKVEHRLKVITSILASTEYKELRSRKSGAVESDESVVSLHWGLGIKKEHQVGLKLAILQSIGWELGAMGVYYPIIWLDNSGLDYYSAFGVVLNIVIQDSKHFAPSGWVFYGPKSVLRCGTYKIKISIQAELSDLLLFDVVHRAGTEKITEIKFFGNLTTELLVNVPENVPDIEFRLFNLNGRLIPIKIDSVAITKVVI